MKNTTIKDLKEILRGLSGIVLVFTGSYFGESVSIELSFMKTDLSIITLIGLLLLFGPFLKDLYKSYVKKENN